MDVTITGTGTAEEIQRAVPDGARVLKVLTTTFAGTRVGGRIAVHDREAHGKRVPRRQGAAGAEEAGRTGAP